MPVGIEPMSLLRAMTPRLPESYEALGVRPLDGLMDLFGEVVRAGTRPTTSMVKIWSSQQDPEGQYCSTTGCSPRARGRFWPSPRGWWTLTVG